MLDIQPGRRNLSPIQRIAVTEKYRPIYERQAKEKQSKYYGNQYDGRKSGLTPNLGEVPINKKSENETNTKLAKIAGVGKETYRMGAKVLDSDDEELKSLSNKKVRWSTIRKNTTHIKYIKVLDKLYKVTDISLSEMSISASECENPAPVAEKDVFLLEELQEFHITLYNKHEKPNITDFSEWKKQHNCQWNQHFFIVYMSLYI